MANLKVKKVKTPKVNPNGSTINVLEIEYEASQRWNLEQFHPNGAYSGVEATVKVKAEVKEGVNAQQAINELCEFVDRNTDQKLKQRLIKAIKKLESQSSR